MDGGMTAQRDGGMTAQRDGGMTAQRDGGMTAQRDGGMTAGRREYGAERRGNDGRETGIWRKGDLMMWGYARVVVESV